MKRVAILGSTGSIGINALKVISAFKDRFKVVGLSANSNVEVLDRQIRDFEPEIVCVSSLKDSTAFKGSTKVVSGAEGLSEVAAYPEADIVVVAITGSASLIPLLDAIRSGKQIALANKEALVSAGQIIMDEALKNNVNIVPVDSEHSAIFQCLDGRGTKDLRNVYLTATGGPLKDVSEEMFDGFDPEEVVKHPRWNMGKKISVDSATLMNKGLEVIEARWLFSVALDRIRIVVHPEAIIHSMVEFIDGSIIAQLSVPDMRLPIQYALSYPDRIGQKFDLFLDFAKIKRLTFEQPDTKKFPCLRLALNAAKDGGTYPTALNASNEEAVFCYLGKKLKFTDIPNVIEKVLSRHRSIGRPGLDDVLKVDQWAREEVRRENCSR